jgi:hypothetical protein
VYEQVAPRGLLVIENTGQVSTAVGVYCCKSGCLLIQVQVWLGNYSCWGDCVTGHMVYEALGVPDHFGCSQVRLAALRSFSLSRQ